MREYLISSPTTPKRLGRWPSLVLILFLSLCAAPCTIAQIGPEMAYQARRHKAAELFYQGKRLEALPLLEELTETNAKDDEMLVALAACLVEHAATVNDQEAAGKERLPARELLDKTLKLGNTSTLAMNLSQLLKQLPEARALTFSAN